ncbi:4'-phosphopantetheinyl transferase family protein [Streptomyces sp. NPDC096198]|uniref:4'-phosphopantetheinyl transferase family protein n=1 Tax=Streptomyces sp. NPDC096198 TaxID=3366080 RepID=UPI0037F4B9E0
MTAAVACRVWWAGSGDHRPELDALLGPAEAVRRERYARAADRRRFSVSAALLRLAVARELGCAARDVPVVRECPDCALPHGRPRIEGQGPLHVSVSYAGEAVAVAVSRGAVVGLDAEAGPDAAEAPSGGPPTRRRLALERALRPEERAEVGAAPEEARPGMLVRWWTYKEAVLKATGDGLRVPPTDIGVSRRTGGARLTAYPGRPELLGDGTVLRDVGTPAGWLSPAAVASVAFLVDRGTRVDHVRGEDGRVLLDAAVHP